MTTAARLEEVNTKSQTGQIISGIALSLMTTAMLILAFPPTNIWPFAFFCLVPMLVAQYRILPRHWTFLAPTFGTALWVFWLVTMLFGFRKETWFILLVPVLVVFLNFLTTRGTCQFHERSKYRYLVLHGMADWVGFEMIRSFIPLVHMHGFIGHTVHTQPWLIQPVSIFSIYGLDLVIILVNFALAQGVFALLDRKWTWADVPPINKRQTRNWLVIASATLGVWIAISLVILAGAPKDPATVRVAAVQSGVTTPAHWPADQPQDKFLTPLFEQTRNAGQQGAKLVVWSELAVGFDPQKEHTEELRALAADTGATIVIGYGVAKEGEVGRNAATPLTPNGEFLASYGKSHPAPGEIWDPDAGKYPVYTLPSLGAWGTIICHDANFTEPARILTRKGARLLAVPTFETTIPGFERIFYIQMVFRSVENRISTIKADSAFSSAIIDPYGRILELKSGAPDGEAFTLVADVPVVESGTLTTRLGDWMGWISLAGYAFFMVFPGLLKKRQQQQA